MQENKRRRFFRSGGKRQSLQLVPRKHSHGAVPAPIPEDEPVRLIALRSFKVLDTAPEEQYDALTNLAAAFFRVPVAQISFIDAERQFIKSSFGVAPFDTPRDLSFCAHVVFANAPITVLDTLEDPRFCGNPLVQGDPHIRFYAGAPIRTVDGMPIGAFCVVDREPRTDFGEAEQKSLERFATLAADLLEQRLVGRRIVGAERQLKEIEERLVLATQATSDGIWDYSFATGHLFYSSHCQTLLGLPASQDQITLEEWVSRIHPRDITRLAKQWTTIQNAGESNFHTEMRFLHENGSWVWMMMSVNCQRDEDGELLRITGAASDVTARMIKDSLTGLYNRESLVDQLQRRIDTATLEPRNFALYCLDLDSFKLINDSLGHAIGNTLLSQVAARLEATIQNTPGSIAARLGGDEFAVLVSDLEGESDAVTFAALLAHLMSTPFECDGRLTYVSASIGVAFGSSRCTLTATEMLEEADIAMFHAKKLGKGHQVLFQGAMKAAAIARLNMEMDLRTAVEREQIEVHYQPKVDLDTGRLVGLEALVRWRHPILGLLSPEHFIPIAEEAGLINAIGDSVARQAIFQLSAWIQSGIVDPDTTIAINISARQIRQANLWRNLQSICACADLPRENLVIEITESVFIEDANLAADVLQECVDAGFGLDLDDFGTGYSSLGYLHHYPFQNVKIDRLFINCMMSDAKSRSLVDSIIQLAASLDMGVIAEGVETLEQAAQLQILGCGIGQGYLFSRPVSAAIFESVAAKRYA